MQSLILGIWIIQGFLMTVDEFYFHHKRGLKKWERVGHPIDTFLFLLCFVYTLTFPPSELLGFGILSILSTLIITKDEFIHTEECEGTENFLHAFLFILHPLALMGLFFAWKLQLNQIIMIQTGIIGSFMLYQIIFWNFIKRNYAKSPKS